MPKHKLTKIQAGPHYTKSIYEYRGIRIKGTQIVSGWRGGAWNWWTDTQSGLRLEASTRKELIEKIDKALDEWGSI